MWILQKIGTRDNRHEYPSLIGTFHWNSLLGLNLEIPRNLASKYSDTPKRIVEPYALERNFFHIIRSLSDKITLI